MKFTTFLKYLWASPNTLLAVPFMLPTLWGDGKLRMADGSIQITNWWTWKALGLIGAQGLTLGHAVIYSDSLSALFAHRHEMVHVRQYETFGPFFLPLYFMLSFHAWRTGEHYYMGNLFEVEAYGKGGR